MSRSGANKVPIGSKGKGSDNSKSNERNEYIPSFIAKKPFYIDDATASQDDYLEHQRLQSQKNHDPLSSSQWYDRGKVTGPTATKFRKGACANCGSRSHDEKECLQRKRKQGAKWTGRDIAADECVQDVKLGWDAKRDRWNGYDASEYQEVIEDYNAVEAIKKQTAGEDRDVMAEADGEDAEVDGDKYEAETDMGRKQATSTRNLRLREDTAKYLLNLDLDSAKYDPKTRSMLDTATSTNELIAEDGFQRASGDAAEFERAQTYAWETQERGDRDKIHLQANPTEAQLTRKRKAEDDLHKQHEKKKALLDKYGTQDAVLKKPGVAASSETYVEYDDRGKIKGAPERKVKSMYAEDVLVNNHTSVWGSWWLDFRWGYACCHSTVKNSFCTGEEGRVAAEEAEKFSKGLLEMPSAEAQSEVVLHQEVVGEEARNEEHVSNGVDRPEKLKVDESRRRIEEMKAGVSEAELEQYRRDRVEKNDPMAAMLGKDQLVGS